MNSPRILVVDDDDDLRELICDYLSLNGMDVASAKNALELDRRLAENPFDCIILDLMLPGEDGLSVLKRLRGPERPAIIMLSAIGTDVDRIVGLELGADDYLAKPCNPRELLARVRALLRRNDLVQVGPVRRFGQWTLDLVHRRLTSDGQTVVLTDSEFRLLRAFLNQPQSVLTRDQLIDLSKSSEALDDDRSIDVRVSRLRKKLGPNPPIRTVRNEGYMFTLAIES